jgi:metal-responsive CopG/Arc/MetJ family transcriptional regulator
MRSVTIRVPQSVLDEVDRVAAEDGVTRSTMIRRMMLTCIAVRPDRGNIDGPNKKVPTWSEQ